VNVNRLFWHLLQHENRILRRISQLEYRLMSELTDLQAAVAAEDTVIASAVTLLEGLKAKLDAAIAAGDPVALKALSDDIGNQTAALSAAVTANTPAG
jgi:hypothetical protein